MESNTKVTKDNSNKSTDTSRKGIGVTATNITSKSSNSTKVIYPPLPRQNCVKQE
jgi:hypothetical protein